MYTPNGVMENKIRGKESTSVTKERSEESLCVAYSVVGCSVCDAQVDYVNAVYNRSAVSDCVIAL